MELHTGRVAEQELEPPGGLEPGIERDETLGLEPAGRGHHRAAAERLAEEEVEADGKGVHEVGGEVLEVVAVGQGAVAVAAEVDERHRAVVLLDEEPGELLPVQRRGRHAVDERRGAAPGAEGGGGQLHLGALIILSVPHIYDRCGRRA